METVRQSKERAVSTYDDELEAFRPEDRDEDASPLTEDIDEFDDDDVERAQDSDDEDDDDESDESDDDESGDEDDEDDDDDFDDLDDATDDEIDFVVALYREDGEPVAQEMTKQLANDLDELINQLARIPGDAGATALVSVAGEFFVICRVRGRNVQVFCSDGVAANDWPLARDVVDYLGLEVADPDDDPEPIGDLEILADQGLSEFDLVSLAGNLEEDSDVLAAQVAEKVKFGVPFGRAIDEI